MAAAPNVACLSGVGAGVRNVSTGVETTACNGTRLPPPPYSPEATAAFASTITLMMLFTIFGNILVIIAVLTSRALRGPQNLFLVSLAAADILVATLIIPFSLANELLGYWYFRSVWCEIYLALDVLFCTSSIVHLCAISLDRYLSVSRAVTYSAHRTPRRIKAAIVVVWLISAVISFPPLLSMNKSQGGGGGGEGSGDGPRCQLNNERWYILYSTVGSFFAPCLIMILVYVRIYQIAKRHTRCPPGEPRKDWAGAGVVTPQGGRHARVQQNGAEHGGDAAAPQPRGAPRPPTLALPASLPPPCQTKTPTNQQNLLQLPSSSSAPTPIPTSPSSSPQAEVSSKPEQSQQRSAKRSEKQLGNNNDDSSSSGSDMEAPGGHGSNGTASNATGTLSRDVHTPSLALKYRSMIATSKGTQLASPKAARPMGTPNTARRKAMVNREKRFTFVLAVVIGVFVVCWFPFFFSYSLQAICPEACSLPEPLFKFFFWIGYCNSSLNPLIYTIFNQDFRKAFKKILCKNGKDSLF